MELNERIWNKLFSYTILRINLFHADFTRLKLVQSSKEAALKVKEIEDKKKEEEAKAKGQVIQKANEEDITAQFDADDDEDVVF